MSLTSYRAAPPRVTMCWAGLCQPGSFLIVQSDVVGVDGGLLHPASRLPGCFVSARCVLKGDAKRGLLGPLVLCHCGMGFFVAPASMPGDVLLFRRLSVSTIGAVRFHGRVRDGIGWVTDAMVTKQWSWRNILIDIRASFVSGWLYRPP